MIDKYAIYVHIPFCKARCAYCAFSSCVDFDKCDAYFDRLCEEISNAVLPTETEVTTMFWGGGTPSSVSVAHLEKLYKALDDKFDLSTLSEFTVECNPESASREMLSFLKSIGVNRISFGLQSANEETLHRIGRLHTYTGFLQALITAQTLGFSNVNADIILGLPETEHDFCNTVEKVAKLPLKHISLYALEMHDNPAFQRLCAQYPFSEDQLADLYDYARAKFSQAGYHRYEVSNFAKPGCECKHNLVYWTENRYFGFGASACGFVGHTRYGNAFDIDQYVSGGGECECDEISPDEEMCEYVMLGLRLEKGFALTDFLARFGVPFEEKFPAYLSLESKGFLQTSDGMVRVPSDKFYVLNSILVELLPD